MKNKLILFFLGLTMFFFIVFSFLFFLNPAAKEEKKEEKESNLITPPEPTRLPKATPNIQPMAIEELERESENLDNRTPTNDNETSTRNQLKNSGKDGVLEKNEDWVIRYNSDQDLFQGEILTTDISSAREKVKSWFTIRGIAKDKVCELPLILYRDPKKFDTSLSIGLDFYSCNYD
ncbi:hypothetical protein KKG52_03945 [Patescibacteria group bacterium]|nr:hypothetical protein [Patescibacteria group bacterium]